MRAASFLGIILMAAGILSLAYFASPIRLMSESTIGLPGGNHLAAVFGGVSLLAGLLLVFVIGSKKNE
jgi:uncharacterized membrane protein YphA (DoxX/SURF4 family)